MQKTQVSSLGQEDALEKGMATHSSILAWTRQRSLAGNKIVCEIAKSQTQLRQTF